MTPARLVLLAIATAAILPLAGCGGEKSYGDRCVQGVDDCGDKLTCLDGFCLELSTKALYQACIADGECQSSMCMSGFCSSSCHQYVTRGKYSLNQCVNDIEISQCDQRGVGCCLLTSIERGFNDSQDKVSGHCTANP